MEQLEFHSFLLKLSNELQKNEFDQLKFVLKGVVSSGTSESMRQPFHFFEELEKRRLLTTTHFGILKKAFDAIGRLDLVEELDEKEKYFTDLFKPKLKDGDNLEQEEYDAVCDSIDKEGLKLKPLPRSDIGIPNVRKQILMDNRKEDDLQHDEEVELLIVGKRKENKDVEMSFQCPVGSQIEIMDASKLKHLELTSGEDKGALPGALKGKKKNTVEMKAQCFVGSPEETLGTGKVKHSGPTGGKDDGGSPGATSAKSSEDPKEAMLGKEEPYESVTDGNVEKMMLLNKLPYESGEALSFSTLLPNMFQHHDQGHQGDDVVPDGNEDEKAESEKASGNDGAASSGAGVHTCILTHDYGGARPKHKSVKLPVLSDPHEQLEEGNSVAYGTLSPDTTSGKHPVEDECSSSPFTSGYISQDNISSVEMEQTQKKAEVVNPCSEHLASASGSSPWPQGIPSHKYPKGFKSHSASGYHSLDLGYGSVQIPANGTHKMETLQQMIHQLSQIVSAGASNHNPSSSSSQFATIDSPVQPRSYNKAGYSVVISGGRLCHSTDEMGVVMMESGAQFHIEIGNNNNCDAEVDITFGGMFLGVWLVEAKRSLSRPLIVEGSSWAKGRLKFYSASDTRAPETNSEYYGEAPEPNGIIELVFKPEVEMLHLHIKHAHNKSDALQEILMPNFKTATVGDLKREINLNISSKVSCVVKDGVVLQEDRTMSSYALGNKNEVIEVLYTQEKLIIASTGRDPVAMMVDPCSTSLQDVKKFIENKIGIPADDQCLCYDGQNMDDANSPSLTDIFVNAKETPVLKVEKNSTIIIIVYQPNGNEQRVEMKWLDTVNELKQVLVDRNICTPDHILTFKDTDLNKGSKQLVALGFTNKSKIVIREPQTRSTHRGFSFAFSASHPRGFGETTRGYECDGFRSNLSRFHSGPQPRVLRGDRDNDSFGEKGRAILCGNEENVFKGFQMDKRTSKFSKEKAVKLVIQLVAKRVGATTYYESSGHKSTPYPPPVPE